MRLDFGHGAWRKRFNLRMRDSALENCQIELLRLDQLDRKPPESCLLKLFTLIIEHRIREWAEKYGKLPPSQNGFREGFRTHNNSQVLRTAIDKTLAEGTQCYVAFVDLTNAFPSTDLSRLWTKIHAAGVRGPLFDWLRMLYTRMSYVVRSNGEVSSAFRSLLGLLTGDTASPILWNLYFADLDTYIFPDNDDVEFEGVRLSHLEQADDVALFSTTMDGLQRKMDGFFEWCRVNFMVLSVAKTKWMVFGALPRNLHQLVVDGRALELVSQYKYVGAWFCSTTANIFSLHYDEKARKARSVAGISFALDNSIGLLTPTEARQLYLARVDPHLTFGCEVMLDTLDRDVKKLEECQISYLRRMLSLSRHSQKTPLFTETGLMPIRVRRLILALHYLAYLLSLPPTHLASLAVRAAVRLAHGGKPSWFGDLQYCLVKLTGRSGDMFQMSVDDLTSNDAGDTLKLWEEWVIAKCEEDLQGRLELSVHLPLIRNRVSPKIFALRPYLRVRAPHHRQAMTCLVLGEHILGVEVLRRESRHHGPVPIEFRLCRFCRREQETEIHALTECEGHADLASIRTSAIAAYPDLVDADRGMEIERVLHSEDQAGLEVLAKLCYDILEVFGSRPVYRVDPIAYNTMF